MKRRFKAKKQDQAISAKKIHPPLNCHGHEDDQGLHRILNLRDATCVVVGAIIGVGIFFTPTNVASICGSESLALWAWAIGGAIALLGALTFAELGGLYSRAGGSTRFCGIPMDPRSAFSMGSAT